MSNPLPARRSLLVLGALLVLALAPRAPAQEAQAVKAAKAAAKAQLKLLKSDLAGIVKDFDQAVDDFELAVETGEPELVLALENLTAAWNAAQLAGKQSVFAHVSALLDVEIGTLGDFQTAVGGPEGGPYPLGYNPGDGGAQDLLDAGWRKELEKARAKMEGRLVKLRKPFLKKFDLVLDVRTRAPALQIGYAVNAAAGGLSSFGLSSSDASSIDLVLTLDPVGTEADALIALAGSCVASHTMSVTLTGGTLPDITGDVLASPDGRWEFLGTSAHEGNYSLKVQDGADPLVAREAVGVG
ncbi:MAG TPA: hypothetical protein VFY71_03585 [Planctomycetota bacterium]|nr:hypothetical protein [Planctomycetota bacterium]